MGVCASKVTEKHPPANASGNSTGNGTSGSGRKGHIPKIISEVFNGNGNGDDKNPNRATHQAIELLGRGTEGETWAFRDLRTHEVSAVKLIKRPIPKRSIPGLVGGLSIQGEVGECCVNVVSIKEVVLTNQYLAVVMEHGGKNNLTSYVARQYKAAAETGLFIGEDEARYYFRQFVTALHQCHERNIAHRDMKLDNTLLNDRDPPFLKITDFGFAKRWGKHELPRMGSHLGTPVYMSPELIHDKEYDAREVDVWASGVMLLVMLMGAFPFDPIRNEDPGQETAAIWLQEVTKGWTDAPQIKRGLSKLSPALQDLLNKIFVVDPTKRISVDQIIEHPWYNKALPPKYQAGWEELQREQTELDAQQQHVDSRLLAERNRQLEELVTEAATPPPGHRKYSAMRPLSLMSLERPNYKRLDMRASAVAAGKSVADVTAGSPPADAASKATGTQLGSGSASPASLNTTSSSSPFAAVKAPL